MEREWNSDCGNPEFFPTCCEPAVWVIALGIQGQEQVFRNTALRLANCAWKEQLVPSEKPLTWVLIFHVQCLGFTVSYRLLSPIRALLIAQLLKNLPEMQETPVQFLGQEDLLEKQYATPKYSWASLVAQLVKNLPAMQEIPVWFLGQKDPLEEGKTTHSNILSGQSMGLQSQMWLSLSLNTGPSSLHQDSPQPLVNVVNLRGFKFNKDQINLKYIPLYYFCRKHTSNKCVTSNPGVTQLKYTYMQKIKFIINPW